MWKKIMVPETGPKKTVLYLTRYYMPSFSAAGIRAGRFVDALSQSGHKVIVATVGEKACLEKPSKDTSEPWVCRVSGRGDLPPELCSERTLPSRPWRKPLPGPDPDPKCSRGLFQACYSLVQHHKPDMIYVTSPPFSLLAIAHEVADICKLTLIVEMRDAWYGGMYWPYRNARRRRLAREWEARCLSDADVIVTVTQTHKKILQDNYPADVAGKIVNIPHSFDKSLLEEKQPHSNIEQQSGSQLRKKNFTITYVGQVRGIDVTTESFGRRALRGLNLWVRRILLGANFCEKLRLDWMSPIHLLRAMAQLAEREAEFRERVRLVFVGQKYNEIDLLARQMNLSTNVRQYGPQSPVGAQKFVSQADLLVVNLYGIVGMDYHWCVPCKLYTYLGTQKPVLALLPPGEARDLVLRAGTGFVAEPDNVEAIADVLESLFRQHLAGKITIKPDRDFIRQFDHRHQQSRFVRVVESVGELDRLQLQKQNGNA
jgi:glycosyltransferase involved in cell wall biosynthesis